MYKHATIRLLALCCVFALCAASLAQPRVTPALRFLTSGPPGSQDQWPCFSPDGKEVLFSRSFDGRSWQLWIVKADGGEPHRLAELPVSATRASWSYKSHLIAFTGVPEPGKGSIWIVDPDGRNPRQLARAGLSDRVFYPSWYPDADELAVMDVLDLHDLVIRRVDLRGGAVATLTDRHRIMTGMPSVSPDGKWIAFAGQLNKGAPYDQTQNNIWLLDLGKGTVRSLETPPKQGRAPSWSPDSKRVAFESDRGTAWRRYAIFVVDLDGSHLQQITKYGLNATHPVWSPDGRQMVFSVATASWYVFWRTWRIAIVDLPAHR